MEKIVSFKDISFSYDMDGKVSLLENLSFDLYKGKYSVLLGHNGSGKSTIAKLIIGLLEPSNGKIEVFNKELNEENIDAIRSDVAIVFQNPDNQFIGSTVEDDIAFGLENRCIEQDKMQDIINEYASKVGMLKFLKQEPSELSGGQKQRVAIAGALALHPKLLILDEATSMLDPKGKKEINNLIKSIKDENPDMAILSITHHIDEALMADEIIILNDGKVEKRGEPKEILFDKELLESNNLLPPFVVNVQTILEENGISIDKCYSIEELAKKL